MVQLDQINKTNKYKAKVSLPAVIKEEIEPIFRDLSKDDLLSICLHGRTQNANEAFNPVVWEKCPKSVYAGRSTVELGVCAAVLCYNEGAEGVVNVLDNLGIKGRKIQH